MASGSIGRRSLLGARRKLRVVAAGCGDDVGSRGGAWTAAHLGAVVDGVRASASAAHAEEYCATHHVSHSVTFFIEVVR